MKTLSIVFGKIVQFFMEPFGKGSSLPGMVARKIDINIPKKIELPKTIIAVTGSSGKSSTSYMIYRVLKDSGLKVIHNSKGSNLINGVTSLLLKGCKLNGKSKIDALVIEVDERYTKEVFGILKPTHVVLLNITRDQPPRHGDYTKVYNVIKTALPSQCCLICNGDDPISYELSLGHKGKKNYFGINKNGDSFNQPISHAVDMLYCPKCHHKLHFNYVQYSNVGNYYCPNCDFKTPKLDYVVSDRLNDTIKINHQYEIKMSYDMLYFCYNVVAAYSTCALLGIIESQIAKTLNNIQLLNQRFQSFQYQNRQGEVLTGKNENAISYNQAINYLRQKSDEKTIIFGFEYISKRYSYQDISWLYDIDFELIPNVKNFICVGPFAYDIASRLLVTNIPPKSIIICEDLENIKSKLAGTKGNIYAILNMGTDEKFLHIIKG